MDHIMDWAKLIVPSVISIIGFVLTYYSMCKQFRNSIKQQLTEEQRKVYFDTYVHGAAERRLSVQRAGLSGGFRPVLKQKPDNRAYITNEISTIVWQFLVRYFNQIMNSSMTSF